MRFIHGFYRNFVLPYPLNQCPIPPKQPTSPGLTLTMTLHFARSSHFVHPAGCVSTPSAVEISRKEGASWNRVSVRQFNQSFV